MDRMYLTLCSLGQRHLKSVQIQGAWRNRLYLLVGRTTNTEEECGHLIHGVFLLIWLISLGDIRYVT